MREHSRGMHKNVRYKYRTMKDSPVNEVYHEENQRKVWSLKAWEVCYKE